MPQKRGFYVVSIPKAIDSDETMTKDFNNRFDRIVPAGASVHFVAAVEVQGRVLTFFREYDEPKGGKR